MKKRIRIGLRKTGVCLLTAVLVLSAPVAAFASEPAGDEGIISEQTFGDEGYDFGEIPEFGVGLGTGAETGEGIDGDIQTEVGSEGENGNTEIIGQSGSETDFAEEVENFLSENPVSEPEIQAVEDIDLTDSVVFLGADEQAPMASEDISLDDENVSDINDILASAVDAQQFSVDVSDFQIPMDEADEIISSFLNDNPRFFYVEGACAVGPEEDVAQICFDYADDATTKKAEYEQVVANVLSGVHSSWTTEQKMFYFHDYIVTHTRYEKVDGKTEYSSYGCLVGHECVCQGYSLAFKDLCYREGIWCGYISSTLTSGGRHGWNIVELNGDYFYVDCTWDDSSGSHNYDSYCEHECFLKSQESFDAGGHEGESWELNLKDEVRGKYNNTKYDSAVWTDTISPVVCLEDGSVLFIKYDKSTKIGHVFRYTGTPASAETICDVAMKYKVFGNEGSVYTTSFSSIARLGNTIFVNNYNTIQKIDLANKKSTVVYTLSTDDAAIGFIYGMSGSGKTLTCSLATDRHVENLKKVLNLNMENIIDTQETVVTLNKNFVVLTSVGQTATLSATVTPSGSVESWVSSNPKVATVSSKGVVKAVAPGVTTIKAFSGDKYGSCTVSFNSSWQNDYDTDFDSDDREEFKYFDLSNYHGSAKNVQVPLHAYTDGTEYTTRLSGRYYSATDDKYYLSGVFSKNTSIESVSIEPGVSLYKVLSNTFYNCSALKFVSLANADTSILTTMKYTFYNCTNLEEVDFSGCDFSGLVSANVASVFTNCKNLRQIKTPAAYNSEISIPLPVTMYVLNADGSVGTQAITDLKNAPLNSTLFIAPPTVSLSSTTSGVVVTWSAFKGASKYRVLRKEGSGSYVALAKVGTTTYTDKTAEAGKTYTYTVRCTDENGAYFGGYNKAGKSITVTVASDAPVVKVTNSANGVVVTWNAVSGATKYRVLRKNVNGEYEPLVKTTKTTYTDTSAEEGMTYIYTVRCMNDANKYIGSYDKNGKSILFKKPTSVMVSDLKLKRKDTGIQLSWTAVEGAANYRVLKMDETGKFVAVSKRNKLYFTDTDVEPGKTYTYTVRVMDSDGHYIGTYDKIGKSMTY